MQHDEGAERPKLIRAMGRWDLTAVGVNQVIGSGIFVMPAAVAAAVGIAYTVSQNGWGLFNLLSLPFWLEVCLAVLLLDLAIYLQHLLMHRVPLLWRLHRVHHADLDYDVTTGARFHPIEIILSMLIKFATIAVLGPPVLAVVIFEVLLNATAMFNHGNVHIPGPIDRVLRWFVVTPDMHRVHHSVEDDEANSNFGFNLPWWDRLPGMLPLPFVGEISGYAINRREWRGPARNGTDAQAR